MSDADRTALEQWAKRRDAEAFNALASRHAGMVYATCRRVLGNATDAEDVAQECFEALAQVGRARKARSLGAWLHGTATNRSLQRLRSEKRRKAREARFTQGRAGAVKPADAGSPAWDDVYEHVDAAIAELPEKFRIPVVAHFLQGQSHTTIAENLGESRQTVAYRIKTGIDRIRVSLRRCGVLITGDTLDDALAAVPVESAPETLTPALGKLALSGVGPQPSMLSGLLTARNSIIAGVVLVLAGVAAWVFLAHRAEEPGVQRPGLALEEKRDDSATPNDTEPSAVQPETPVVASTPPAAKEDISPLPGTDKTPVPAQPKEPAIAATPPTVEKDIAPLPATDKPPVSEEPKRMEIAQAPIAFQQIQPGAGWVYRPAQPIVEPSPVGALAELKIELPDPSFSGTPLDYWSANLEMTFKPRPTFFVPQGTNLLSKGCPATSSDVTVAPAKLAMVTDGDKRFDPESVLMLKPGVHFVQIDLQRRSVLHAIVIWHFHEYERVYKDVVVVVSDDPEFNDAVVLFNNDHDNSLGFNAGTEKEYIEKAEGKLIDAGGTAARYVRLYSNGSSSDDANTYVEVEVFGTKLGTDY